MAIDFYKMIQNMIASENQRESQSDFASQYLRGMQILQSSQAEDDDLKELKKETTTLNIFDNSSLSFRT